MDTTRQLVRAVAARDAPEAFVREFDAAGGDWNDLTVRALVMGLAPLLFARLGEHAPARVRSRLASNHRSHAERYATIRRQLTELLEAWTAAGLRPIVLKGVHLAERVYDDPALRPMNDIDVLFAPGELGTAERVLADLGYRGRFRSPDCGPGVVKHTSTWRRGDADAASPNPYLSGGGERMVEPHGSLEERWFGLAVDITPGVRDRAVEIEIGGRPCRVLCTEDCLLHLCVHLSFNLLMGQPSMVQLVDLGVFTARETVDWEGLVARAVARGAAAHVLASLELAVELLGAPVPQAARWGLSAALPRSLRRTVRSVGLPHVLRRTQQGAMPDLRARLRRGLTDRAAAAAWAPDLATRWRVWRTALAFTRTDTWRRLLSFVPQDRSDESRHRRDVVREP